MNKFDKVYKQIIKECKLFKAARRVIKEQNQIKTIPEITEAQPINAANFTFLNKLKRHVEQNFGDVLQIYIHGSTADEVDTDEINVSEEMDFQKADIVVLTTVEYEKPGDIDYIVVQYQKNGSKIKKVYDSDDGLTAQQMGKYADPNFVVDTVLKNAMEDIGPLNTWYKIQ